MSHVPTQAAFTSMDGGPYIVRTPVWCTVVRGFTVFFAFIIMVLAGLLMHGYVMTPNAFALVCGLFTIIFITYALVTEKVPSANIAYNIWAVLSLDTFLAILWLSSMGANAALRATFLYSVDTVCYNDGGAFNSEFCGDAKRDGLQKRDAVASNAGLAEISAIAGLSALQMILHIAVLVYNGHTFRMYHQGQPKATAFNNANMEEMGPYSTPAGAPQYPQYNEQQEYKPQVYNQSAAAPQPYDYAHPSQQQQQQQYPYPVAPSYVYPQMEQELPDQRP